MPRYGDLADLLAFLPDWAALLLLVVLMTWTVCMAGVALGKTGRSPYWVLLAFLFPPLLVAGLWWLAFAGWPRQTGNEPPAEAQPGP